MRLIVSVWIFSLLCVINLTKCDEPNSSLQNQDDVRYFTNYSASINSSENASQNGPINFNLNITDTEDDLKVSGLNETSNGEPITNQTQIIDDLNTQQVANDTPIDTEVNDLLHNTETDNGQYLSNEQHPLEPEITIHIPDKIDQQFELIEDGENTEDELRRHKEEETNDEIIHNKPLAVVLISMFVAMSILCYAAFLIWRNYLENRYGSRTLLVEAEEFPAYSNPSDLKHFSI